MPNPFMGSGVPVEDVRAERERRRGNPPRGGRQKASGGDAAEAKAARLREQAATAVAEGTVGYVVEWVGGKADRAAAALAAETSQSSPRVSLVRKLEAIAG